MLIGGPRPILCWDTRGEATQTWTGSDGSLWRPAGTHYPDTQKLEAGDILLFRPTSPTVMQRIIQRYEDGTFTHAAVYLQNDHLICHAMPNATGVELTSLEPLLKSYCILARRLRNLDKAGRREIAVMATSLMGSPYGFIPIVESVIRRLTGKALPVRLTTGLRRPIICSTLCEHAIMAGTKGTVHLTRRAGDLLVPEDLAATDLLEDVEITWQIT